MALGTDAENVSNHQDICRSMQLAALLPRDARRDPTAVTAEQAVEMATISGATALWMHDETGSLEPGKQADMVVFDTADFDWRPLHNPVANLVYGVTGHSVDTVLVGGDVLLYHKRADPGRRRRAARAGRADQPPRPGRDRHRPPARLARAADPQAASLRPGQQKAAHQASVPGEVGLQVINQAEGWSPGNPNRATAVTTAAPSRNRSAA